MIEAEFAQFTDLGYFEDTPTDIGLCGFAAEGTKHFIRMSKSKADCNFKALKRFVDSQPKYV